MTDRRKRRDEKEETADPEDLRSFRFCGHASLRFLSHCPIPCPASLRSRWMVLSGSREVFMRRSFMMGGAFALRAYTVAHLPLWTEANVVALALNPESRLGRDPGR